MQARQARDQVRAGRGVAACCPRQLLRVVAVSTVMLKNFKKKAKAALDKVRGVYPALKISQANGGFMLHPGSTAVAPALN